MPFSQNLMCRIIFRFSLCISLFIFSPSYAQNTSDGSLEKNSIQLSKDQALDFFLIEFAIRENVSVELLREAFHDMKWQSVARQYMVPSSITPPLLEYIAALGVDDGRGLLTRTVMAHGMAQKLKEHPVWSGLARGAQVWVGGEPACSAGSESVSVTPPQQCEG